VGDFPFPVLRDWCIFDCFVSFGGEVILRANGNYVFVILDYLIVGYTVRWVLVYLGRVGRWSGICIRAPICCRAVW